jgi:beta-glucanase (GH16 family)
MQLLQLLLLLMCNLVAVRASSSFCDEKGWARVWSDEFDGPVLDASSWNVRNNSLENDSSCREAMCVPENVGVEGGLLVLTARAEHRGWAKWTTGAVNSQTKRYWRATPGSPFRLCVSGMLPGAAHTGAGLWPAFWYARAELINPRVAPQCCRLMCDICVCAR